MKKLSKLLLYGFLIWMIPFAVSVLKFPLHDRERPLFESVMPVVIAACAAIFSVLYLAEASSEFLREGVRIGAVWLATSLILDMLSVLAGPMKMPLIEYVKDIGLTCLIIPSIAVGFGYLLDQKFEGLPEG